MGFAELTPRQLAPSVGTSGTGITVSPAQSASANGSSPITITGPIPFGSFDYNPHSTGSQPANSDLQSGENVPVCSSIIAANQAGTFITAQPSTPASPSTGSAPAAPPSPAKSVTSPMSTPPRSPTLSEMMSLMATPTSTPLPSPTPSEMESLMATPTSTPLSAATPAAPASPSTEYYAPPSAKETASDDAMDIEPARSDGGHGRQAMIDFYFNTAAVFHNNCSNGEEGKISRDTPNQICMVQITREDGAPESSASGANRPDDRNYPMNATMPDGTTIVITREQAIKAAKAINECTMMPEDSTAEELAAHKYIFWQETLRLKSLKAALDERKKAASASSVRRAQLSSLYSSGRTSSHHRSRSRMAHLTESERAALTRDLGMSFMTHDEEGIPIPKTAQGALMSVATYLKATQPPDSDPNAALHRQQIKSLHMAGGALAIVEDYPGGSRTRREATPRREVQPRENRAVANHDDRDRSRRGRHEAQHHEASGDRRDVVTQQRVGRGRSRRSTRSRSSDSDSGDEWEPC